jgi:hypothetical protein
VEAYAGANFFETGVNPALIPSFLRNIETPVEEWHFLDALSDSYFFYYIND